MGFEWFGHHGRQMRPFCSKHFIFTTVLPLRCLMASISNNTRFNLNLSEGDKNDLVAFLKTL
jgi:hypothetical protein